MDTVNAFNAELTGLYETKPPISKAKMASITKSAMRAIKFYKHVVQSVEKFILKCKPEYKIPGLYVIDSIVRQSRHQFGPDKDVFAPRFARNLQTTLINLYRCPTVDKSKIIRVLNLWQKNSVFAPEVIQPIFDMADPSHPIYQIQQTPQDGGPSNGLNISMQSQESPPQNMADEGHTMSSDMSGPATNVSVANQLDSNAIRQLQQLQQFLLQQTGSDATASTSSNTVQTQDSVKFNKKLLDYDYGDDEEEEKNESPSVPNVIELLHDPNVIRQLQTLQKLKQQEEKQSKLTEMRIQEEAFEKHLATVLKKLPFANECDLSRQANDQNQIFGMQTQMIPTVITSTTGTGPENMEQEVELVSDDGKVEVINLDGNSRSPSDDRERYKRRRSRSRSRERLDRARERRRRSRTRSRSPRTRRRLGSRDRDRDRPKDKDKDRDKEKDREYERERRRKGLPELKKEHLSVCTTTLWVGHLSKLVHQEELSDTFGKYGDIVSIDMIHPRGCAFIVMNRRQDAYKAMGGLKNHKLQGRAITVSWAAGKGVKSKEWKDYWDLDLGVSYIPWNKLEETTDFEALEEGGMLDEDTMPDWLRDQMKVINQKKETMSTPTDTPKVFGLTNIGGIDTSQPPPTGLMPMIPPPFPIGPVPRLMQPMGMHMPPNMVPGLPLGVPPPQMLIPPTGMLPSGPPPTSVGPPPLLNHFPPMPTPAMVPTQLPPPLSSMNTSNIDDHMDIENEDETHGSSPPKITPAPLMNPMGMSMFNRPPPPHMFGQTMPPSIPMIPPPNVMQNYNNPNNNGNQKDNGDGRDKQRDRSRSRDRDNNDRDRNDFRGRNRDRDRDRDNGGRNNRDRDRNRREYSRDRDRGNGRWSNDRGRSRDNNRRTSRDRNSRDRNDRDKNDRNRDGDRGGGGGNGNFNRRDEQNKWRDGPPQQQQSQGGNGNFPNMGNFNDRNPRPLMGGPPVPLDEIRLGPMQMGGPQGGPQMGGPQMGGPQMGGPQMGGMQMAGPHMGGSQMGGPQMGGPQMGGPQKGGQQMGGPVNPNNPFRGNDFDNFNRKGDNFDRRGGPPRDFFNQNARFGGPMGMGGRGGPPMGMMRGGPPSFGNRMPGPMFMRGPRPGPPGFNNDRQFFDRDSYDRDDRGGDNRGNMRGGGGRGGYMMDQRRGGGNQMRPNWDNNDRQGVGGMRNDQRNDNNRNKPSSRWGNQENTREVEDVSDSDRSWDENKSTPEKSPTKRTEIPEAEPIDDDSQDFNEFDIQPKNNKSSNDDETVNEAVASVETNQESNKQTTPIEQFESNTTEVVASREPENDGNTTPLYDEPSDTIPTKKIDDELIKCSDPGVPGED